MITVHINWLPEYLWRKVFGRTRRYFLHKKQWKGHVKSPRNGVIMSALSSFHKCYWRVPIRLWGNIKKRFWKYRKWSRVGNCLMTPIWLRLIDRLRLIGRNCRCWKFMLQRKRGTNPMLWLVIYYKDRWYVMMLPNCGAKLMWGGLGLEKEWQWLMPNWMTTGKGKLQNVLNKNAF